MISRRLKGPGAAKAQADFNQKGRKTQRRVLGKQLLSRLRAGIGSCPAMQLVMDAGKNLSYEITAVAPTKPFYRGVGFAAVIHRLDSGPLEQSLLPEEAS